MDPWPYIQRNEKCLGFFLLSLGNEHTRKCLIKKVKKELSVTSERKAGLIFLMKMFLLYFHLNTHTLELCRSKKKEALAQSYMFTLLILPLNKTELSITALKVSFYTGISHFKPTALLFKIC